MQNRQLWFMNVVLASVALLMAVRLGAEWKRGNERYAQLEEVSAASTAVSVIAAPEVQLTAIGEIITKNLFTPDRSSDRPLEAVVPTASAALPVIIGTMQLGPDYEALMAEAGQPGTQRFRRIKAGERIGAHTVVEIRDDAVVVEYQGQRTVVNVYQSAKSAIRAAGNTAPTAQRAPAAPTVDTVAAPPAAGAAATAPRTAPAANSSGAPRKIGDVTVTVEGNRRRYERWTMFGAQVWYEDIQ